jgi:TP901 family phage tail tape measure protein
LSDTLRELVVSLSLDSDNFARNLRTINKQIKEAESTFLLAGAGVDNFEKTVNGLSSKLTMLQTKLTQQNLAVDQYARALTAANQKLADSYARQDKMKAELTTATALYQNLGAKVSESAARYEGFQNAVTQSTTASEAAKSRLSGLTEEQVRAAEKVRQLTDDVQVCSEVLKLSGDAKQADRDELAAMEAALQKAQDEYADLGRQIQVASTAYEDSKKAIADNEEAARQEGETLKRLKEEHQAAADKVKLLEGQIKSNSKTLQNNADAIATAQANLNAAKAAVKTTEAEIAKCNQALALAQTKWDEAGESIKQSQAAIVSFGKQIGLAESRFKLASAGIKDLNKSVEGLSAKLTFLNEKLVLQRESVEKYEDALRAAREQQEAAKTANDPEKIHQATDAVTDAETALNKAKAAVKETEAEIGELNKKLAVMESQWTQAGESLEAFSKKCDKVGKALSKAGRLLTTTVSAPIAALGVTAIKASIDYESAFTSVRKTVDATEDEFAELSSSIKTMSTQVASSASDIAEVVAVAGQLGIANEHLMGFAKTMIDLGNSTDIVAEEAASTLAKFANITNMNQSEFERLGSTLVDLGNNYATTESAIMEMSLRLAAAGHQVGLTESQILGFATALSSVGIEAQMGGSAFSKALVKMEVACATGGDALEDFGKVSGMTAKQFKALFESDPAAAFQAFIVGLSKMDDEGESAIAVLDEIGIKEVRLRDTLLRATNATELFSNTQKTANEAWAENTALSTEANKRYATTESRLTNLKNTALLFAQQIGDDLNPTVQVLIDKANELLASFMGLDESQRMAIIKFAAVTAAVGPAILVIGKMVSGIGKVSAAFAVVSKGIGKFSGAVKLAGGGIGGFVKTLASSKLVIAALAAAVVYGAYKWYDYASGAKTAREALEGMNETAKQWRENAAETFYGSAEGLSFFGMSEEDFTRAEQSSEDWLNGLLAVWSDGKKETNEIVTEWTDSFKALTASTRDELTEMKATADQAGYTGVSEQLQTDIEQLDAMDAEIERLLKKRQSRNFTDKDKIRLQELIDAREAIEIKYHLSPADTDGFDTILDKLEAEVARARAKGQTDASASVYENALLAAAQGYAAINAELDTQYDKEYALVQLIEGDAERRHAQEALDAKYSDNRLAAAREYAQTMAAIVMPVWNQPDIQAADAAIDTLYGKLREYSIAANNGDTLGMAKALEDMNALTSSMDEGALTEYYALLTQIQSLMDAGMSEEEIQAIFPDIDVSSQMQQLASLTQFVTDHKDTLEGLSGIFSEAVPEEVLKIATDLDMTGAQARWDEFAANPGAITTEAIIAGYTEAENAARVQPQVTAFISGYTEIAEGASTASLTPTGLLAYVAKYAEVVTGADMSGLTPENVTAMVSAYEELATGVDVSKLTPAEITAYISTYLESQGVDTSNLTPGGITAFVLAYEEVTGGASTTNLSADGLVAYIHQYAEQNGGADTSGLTPKNVSAMVSAYRELESGADITALTPSEITAYISTYLESEGYDITALGPGGVTAFVGAYQEMNGGASTTKLMPSDIAAIVTSYLEAEEVDVTALSEPQIDALVTAYSEATGCDKTALKTELVAYISKYQNAEGVATPSIITCQVSISGYDLAAYTQFVKDHPVTVTGLVRLGEVYDEPTEVLEEPNATFWENGQEIPVNLVPANKIDATTLMAYEDDGTLHVLITPTISGTPEALEEAVSALESTEHQGSIGARWANDTTIDDLRNLNEYLVGIDNEMKSFLNIGGWMNGWDRNAASSTISNYLDATEIANIQSYVGEAIAALNNGETLSEDMVANLQAIQNLVELMDSIGVGDEIVAGIAQAMTEAGMDTTAETVAANIETALNTALGIESPSTRMMPIGENTAAGIGEGMSSYDMSAYASVLAGNLQTALESGLGADVLQSIGTSAATSIGSGITAYDISSSAGTLSSNAKSALASSFSASGFRSIGLNAMYGLRAGIVAGRSGVISAMRSAALAAVSAAKSTLKISSPSGVFRDEIGRMAMRGFGQGVLLETKRQARVIQNASRYLTGAAKHGSVTTNTNDNRRTYNQSSNVNLTGNTFYVRDEQDIRALAVEIATLTKRQQRGRGLRMA